MSLLYALLMSPPTQLATAATAQAHVAGMQMCSYQGQRTPDRATGRSPNTHRKVKYENSDDGGSGDGLPGFRGSGYFACAHSITRQPCKGTRGAVIHDGRDPDHETTKSDTRGTVAVVCCWSPCLLLLLL
jgi:hypothetical protein